jgi:hypothetical protein
VNAMGMSEVKGRRIADVSDRCICVRNVLRLYLRRKSVSKLTCVRVEARCAKQPTHLLRVRNASLRRLVNRQKDAFHKRHKISDTIGASAHDDDCERECLNVLLEFQISIERKKHIANRMRPTQPPAPAKARARATSACPAPALR